MSVRLLIAGGGTSGHVYPAIAIADRIINDSPGSSVEFCGTQSGIENKLIADAGYQMHVIRASGFPSRPSLKLLRAILDFRAGKKTCMHMIDSFRPDAVVGTGGYVCSPLIAAAAKRKVPIILHEQNAFPGRSNRFLSKKASAVLLGFPGAEKYFSSAKEVHFTGNPIRSIFQHTDKRAAREKLGILPGEFLILAMGGSLGSRSINQAMIELPQCLDYAHIRYVLSAGKQQYSALPDKIKKQETPVQIFEYMDDSHTYMSAADLIICRAGAITCAEVAAIGIPSLMIPYPFAAGDHQTYNARSFQDAGAGIMIRDSDLTAKRLAEEIERFIQRPELADEMAEKAKKLHVKRADEKISQIVMRICAENNDL